MVVSLCAVAGGRSAHVMRLASLRENVEAADVPSVSDVGNGPESVNATDVLGTVVSLAEVCLWALVRADECGTPWLAFMLGGFDGYPRVCSACIWRYPGDIRGRG